MTTTLPAVHSCTLPWCVSTSDDGDGSISHNSTPLILDACSEREHHRVLVETTVYTGTDPLTMVTVAVDREFADMTIDQARQLVANLTAAIGYAESGGVS